MQSNIQRQVRERGLTPDEKRRHAARIALAERTRWFISFSVAGAFNRQTGRYDRYVWPRLFLHEADAWDAIAVLPVFANRAATESRGKIRSVTVAKTVLPQKASAAAGTRTGSGILLTQ